jgi:glycosyltransferase involved in cell wall biosynthesis
MSEAKLRMLIVGAFPTRAIREHGGILTSCRALLGSSLPKRLDLVLLDSCAPSVPPPPYLQRMLRAGGRIFIAAWRLMTAKPDVVLLFASPGGSFVEKSLMAAMARALGIKTLMFPRGAALMKQYDRSAMQRRVLGWCFRIPTLLLCQGEAYRDFFVGRLGFAPERCPVVNNWTATEDLLAVGKSRCYGSAEPVLEILFLGWISREKGIFELLDCAHRLRDRPDVPPFRLVLAGDGAATAEVAGRAEALKLTDIVEMPGWIDDVGKHDRLRTAHLLVLPSYMEGMPNAVIEAMAAGLPVVATDVGAVSDILTDQVNGFLVPPRETAPLCEALHRLLKDPALRESMGRAGWQMANERFNTERAVDRLMQLAHSVCR